MHWGEGFHVGPSLSHVNGSPHHSRWLLAGAVWWCGPEEVNAVSDHEMLARGLGWSLWGVWSLERLRV